MLLYLTNYLAQFESGFNVFNYLTMRAILGALTALVLSFVIGPRMIRKLSSKAAAAARPSMVMNSFWRSLRRSARQGSRVILAISRSSSRPGRRRS